MKNYLIDIFRELKINKVDYCVLRGYEGLPEIVSHDIDMCVRKKQLISTLRTLKTNSNKHNYRLIYKSTRKGITQIYFYKDGICLKIDIWTEFNYKGLFYSEVDSLLNNTKLYNSINVLDNDSEVYISFMKEFLHNKWIRKDKILDLQSKLSPTTFTNNSKWFLNEKNCNKFYSFIRCSRFDLKNEASEFIKELFFVNLKHYGVIKTLHNILDYIFKFLKSKISYEGFFIVLIGPDGSGKTTISKELMTKISNKESKFSSYRYIHGRFGILPNLSLFKGHKRQRTNEINFEIEDKKKPTIKHSKLRVLIYTMYYLVDFILGYFSLFFLKFSNKLIIADRFFYDYFIQEYFNNYPRWVFKLYMYILPNPDLVVYLDADPKNIFLRKPELTVNQINQQKNKISEVLKHIHKKRTIKTDIDKNTSLIHLENSIFDYAYFNN
jgi:thymidylate kinase